MLSVGLKQAPRNHPAMLDYNETPLKHMNVSSCVSRKFPVGRTRLAIIDAEDFEKVAGKTWKTQRSSTGRTLYACTIINGKAVWMHHVVYGSRAKLDHVNHDGLDNRKCNLRPCTESQNQANQRKRLKPCKHSQFKGVIRQTNGRWRAAIGVLKKRLSLGAYDTEEQAARAYDAKALERFGEFACLNFPRPVRKPAMKEQA